MGQCLLTKEDQIDIDISDVSLCVVCNRFSPNDKPMFVCPICRTVIGHMDCVTFWVIIHKHCPYCSNTLITTQ